ncbi:unnamed protein product [Acanthoscelides obtectus]|uniref:Major facilitator superfamily (MFS) profile domain-containing protein n=1 Tax=Acanthoscelides obtectus TaxID=200917 RepID=A0A9P0KTK8_ACAOB|nr:unnamed protein product [Acanthoscelides obtectus]CAK1634464.1 Synaptic vesicle glycoprotein 2B [Acanthoscelides obtectus]
MHSISEGPNREDKGSTHLEEPEIDVKRATFEEAVEETGFGKFNLVLLLVLFFPCLSQVLETVNISYVLPIAQCDLGISLEDKGFIISVSFIGMVVSGFFWGVLSDSFGRKKVLVYGYFLNAFFAMIGAFATSKTMIIIAKFFGGLIISGPFSAAIAHTTEFHSKKYRSKVQFIRGMSISFSNLLLPLFAWAILPYQWDFSILEYNFHSWNVFLMVCATVPLLGGICYMFLPESPKYLMSQGKNTEAMEVFQKVYAVNTGKGKSTFTYKELIKETNVSQDTSFEQRSPLETIKNGIEQLKLILHKPYTSRMILACAASLLVTSSNNTFKLWLPQIFQSINDYQSNHNGTSTDLCTMLEDLQTPEEVVEEKIICSVNTNNMSVYTNSMIVATTRMVCCLICTYLIEWLGSKKLAITLPLLTAVFSAGLYFSRTPIEVLALSSLGSSIGSVADLVIMNITVEMFPTTLRYV